MTKELGEELDMIATYDWHMENLLCIRCAHRWNGAYSADFKQDHSVHIAIQCPRCHSRLGVVPASN